MKNKSSQSPTSKSVEMTKLSRVRSTRPMDPNLPRHDSLVHMLIAAVDAHPDVTAVIYQERRISYGEFGRATAGLARQIAAAGIGRGERVVLMMPNSIEMDVALMAVMATCAQVAPVNPFLTPAELTRVLADVDARMIICEESSSQKAAAIGEQFGIRERLTLGAGGQTLDAWADDAKLALDRAALPRPDDLALLIFTGGSSGVPEGVKHRHQGLLAGVLQHVTVWPGKFGGEIFLNVAPMFHIWGLAYATWVPIYMQSTLVMVPRYDPDKMVQALAGHKVTIFAGGPAPIYMGLLGSPQFDHADLSSLRYCISGGAPCPAELHGDWLAQSGQPLLEGWGMSEGAPFCLNLYDGHRKLLSVGRPVPETEIEVVDLETGDRVLPLGERGEVRVRGPQLMTNYRSK